MPPKVRGAKAKKGAKAKAGRRGAGNARNNPRAFKAASGPNAMRLNAYRALEKQEKQYHVALVDRSVEAAVPPPYIVAVVGPPGVGKSTLIQSLVKHWTKQNLGPVVGPVTVVTGKKRRITIIECPNDMNAMCDVAKVADLALLLVDGAYGFQMETFGARTCRTSRTPRRARYTHHVPRATRRAHRAARRTALMRRVCLLAAQSF